MHINISKNFYKKSKNLSDFLKLNHDGVFYIGHAAILVRLSNKKYIFDILNKKFKSNRYSDNPDRWDYLYFSLIKDSNKYYIDPHLDSKENIFTIILYTPIDDRNINFGTDIYEEEEGASLVKTESGFKNLKLHKTLKFTKNKF